MNIGDLIVHIGAKPSGYRIRMACEFEMVPRFDGMVEIVVFEDGLWDWKDSWKSFKGWNHENR